MRLNQQLSRRFSLQAIEKISTGDVNTTTYNTTTNINNAEASQKQQELSAKVLLYPYPSKDGREGKAGAPGRERGEDEEGKRIREQEGCCTKFTSCRWVVGYMCCAARFSQSALRQCIGMAVVCMTLRTASNAGPGDKASSGNPHPSLGSFPENSGGGGGGGGILANLSAAAGGNAEVKVAEFTWSPQFEGLVLNAFNIGFFFSPILGGHIAGKFGGKRVVLVALLAGSIVTICLPLAAKCDEIFVFVLRVIAGIFMGTVDPAIQALWARWAPKHEKAQLTTCSYTGLSLAGIVTFFVSGYLCGIDLQNGWPFIFYFFGGFALMCTIPWLFLVYDSPDQHPRILESEKILIAWGKGQDGASKKLSTPWRRMLTSGPLWAIVVAHMSYSWVTSWMMAYLPKYLRDVMKFDVDEDGVFSSLPFAGRLVSGFVASYLSDLVIRSGRLSTTTTRKLFQTVGCVSCAVCTLAVGFQDHTSRAAGVTLLVLSMTFQNLTSVAFRINHLDIAPRFAGVMMGMTLTVAMAFSLTGPPITAAIIREGTHTEWLCLFIINAALNIIGAVVFDIFGSAEIQDWAQPPKTDYSPIPVEAITTIDAHNPLDDKPACNGGQDIFKDSSSTASPTTTDEESDSPTPAPQAYSHSVIGDSAVISVEESSHMGHLFRKTEGGGENNTMFHLTWPSPPALSSSQVQHEAGETPNGTVPKHNRLRKRVSSSDLQQQSFEGKVKQAASAKPSLPSHGDAEVDCMGTGSR
ncbi:sialin-like isoform X2 [Babylonia areolata]|uniref:sialin-like isoform X2 n=1 Tax=Babylonia areolata TaxID=304850 RepID=UPI003FD52796